ncbi:uncharacterized protein LOC131008303 [Salvia miltiorrhiza]|uniref:uncharacterized protein LOC131008303 n=1 Tax=Salvia miltiorrhiza TaxID=226208 RepID=UPI0025AD2805|nr:uncharacterized protein LOC131008303 [Salvia miltiorrhiza]
MYDHNGADTFVVNGYRLKPYHEQLAEVEKEKEECHLLDPTEKKGREDVPAVDEQEVEKEASEEMVEAPKKQAEEEQPELTTPPAKKPKKALKKPTPVRSSAKEREITLVPPSPSEPAPSLEEEKTASGSEEDE